VDSCVVKTEKGAVEEHNIFEGSQENRRGLVGFFHAKCYDSTAAMLKVKIIAFLNGIRN
jgi:hypothetical protein